MNRPMALVIAAPGSISAIPRRHLDVVLTGEWDGSALLESDILGEMKRRMFPRYSIFRKCASLCHHLMEDRDPIPLLEAGDLRADRVNVSSGVVASVAWLPPDGEFPVFRVGTGDDDFYHDLVVIGRPGE
jgi:hypothetical protein